MAYNGSKPYGNSGKQNSGGNNRPGGFKPRNDSPKRLPDGYEEDLRSGYFYVPDGAEKPVMKPNFILGYPRKIADALTEWDRNKNKSSQIRRYYDFCVRIRDRMDDGRTYAETEAEFCRLVPLVEYAKSRGLVTDVFVNFINRNIDAVHTAEGFHAFVKHFEAVVAHMKQDKG